MAAGMIHSIGASVMTILPWLVILAVLFSLVQIFATPCNDGRPWWRKPDLFVDFLYWFVGAIVGSWMSTAMLAIIALALAGGGLEDVPNYVTNGRGPLAGLPFWAQVVLYLLITDTLLYAFHRLYHTASLWRFHAIHHASEHLDWTSAARFHPANLVLGNAMANAFAIAAGIAPDVLVAMGPFNIVTGAMVHADLDWTFGPFRYVFASPVFHRWHHTAADRGGSKNFAPTLPFIDVLFGTYYMPAGEKPDHFGVDDPDFPKDFAGQMLYPWRRRPATPETRTPSSDMTAEHPR
jgi:sterol desaturase/sphingolipid hydroxylase (fatty acid hydroxylase superfamily)